MPDSTHAAPAQRYAARAAILGEGTRVLRALPHRERRTVGAWCFLDHLGPVQFAPGQGMHVGAHPHIGLQTFTWMIEGEVVHRDSLGNEQIVRPGQVNLMTAGRGIAHTEDSLHDGARMHAAQLWIALPEAQRHCEPAFANYTDLPRAQLNGWQATLLAGTALGQTAPAQVYSPLVGMDFTAAGPAHTRLALRPEFEYAAMALRGSLRLAGEPITTGEWLYWAPGRRQLDAQCDTAAQWLLLGGLPLAEDILIWWNLVARSQAELERALADWNAGRFARVRPGSPAQPLPGPSLSGARLRAAG